MKIISVEFLKKSGVYLALAVLLIVCIATSADFRSPENLLNILRQVSYSGIIALAMTYVIAAGGIDLSVGSLFALAGVGSIMTMQGVNQPEGVAILCGFAAALAIGAGGGAINGALVGAARIQPFIVTLGTMSIFRSQALYFANAGTPRYDSRLLESIGSGGFLRVATPVWIMLGLTALLAAGLTRTRFGRHVCAVGSNEQVARYSAIRTGMVKFRTYLMTGAFTGLAAFLAAARLNAVSSSNAGLAMELDAIAAVIIGGTAMTGGRATVVGTLAGVVILGIVSNVLQMWDVSTYLQGTVKGLVIIIAVLIQFNRKGP